VNLAQNDVEYASNSSTATTGDNTTAFAYGSSGSLIPAITAAGSRTVKFQSQIQATDLFLIEVSPNGGTDWYPVDQGYANVNFAFVNQNAVTYGLGVYSIDRAANTLTARFGTYAYNTSTYGAVGVAWSADMSNGRWRVRKTAAGAAVGFGIVVPGVSSGLVSASGLPGRTDGQAVANGNVGQVVPLTRTACTASNASWVGTAALATLTPGVWDIRGEVEVPYDAALLVGAGMLSTANGGGAGNLSKSQFGNTFSKPGSSSLAGTSVAITGGTINVSGNTPIYGQIYIDKTSGTIANCYFSGQATRLA
jgi:hypothetical protein